MRSSSAPAIFANLISLAACSSGSAKPDPATSASVTISSAAPAPLPSTSGLPTAQPSASATSSPVTNAFPRTGRPSIQKWCEAPKLKSLRGTDGIQPGCSMIEVGEWIMVACPRTAMKGEEPLSYDRAVPGGGSIATADEVAVGPDPSAADAVVISLRPGTTAKPLFFYRPNAHPEWARTEGIPFSLAQSAASYEERAMPDISEETDRDTSGCAKLGPVPAASASASPVTSSSSTAPLTPPPPAVEIPDVDGQPPLPDDAAWASEKEVLVTGSDALGCKTKVKDAWFFAKCSDKVVIDSVEIEAGKHKTQTVAEVQSGALRISTPYVEGTDFRARIVSGATTQFMKVSWPKGKRPFEVGRVTDTR